MRACRPCPSDGFCELEDLASRFKLVRPAENVGLVAGAEQDQLGPLLGIGLGDQVVQVGG